MRCTGFTADSAIRPKFRWGTVNRIPTIRLDRLHHYHTPDGVYDDIEYTGLKAHVQKFHTEMDDRRER